MKPPCNSPSPQGIRDSSSSETSPVFTTNVTVTFARRFLAVVGRVDKTPDWFVASTSQDLCNQEPYFSEITQEWKLGDYQDLLLLDLGKNWDLGTFRPVQITSLKIRSELWPSLCCIVKCGTGNLYLD